MQGKGSCCERIQTKGKGNEMNFKVTIWGERILMHNGQLADPLNEYTKALKEVTANKKKSDDDHAEIARREFQGGLYHDEKIGPYLPGEMIVSALIEGARKFKLGKEFESSVEVFETMIPLQYEGPRGRAELWQATGFVDRRGVGVKQSRVMRTRPIFKDWRATFTLNVLGTELNREEVEKALVACGERIGLGDGRPRLGGKFVVEKFEEVTK